MVKCLEKHNHLIFLKRERRLLSKFLIKLQKRRLGCYIELFNFDIKFAFIRDHMNKL
jgi:hypothetical protein